ncbi:hypothetical protein Thiowin_00101 [Thiorhodovibrio winogradskyi]|uniref:Uncharacterized protein n=1 Tax=Thiorhodovibrio winogradskyi TaxID=77007 RepID=A0ABZ0S1K9_9GAMM|nr:hypothetical protein [Thiorhodovibrio winogradskyi]
MTLDDVLRDIHAMREDLLVFERKFGVPTEMFYEAYCNGEEPADASWVLDWSEWAAAYQILQERLKLFGDETRRMLQTAQVTSYIDLMERTARRESIPVAH